MKTKINWYQIYTITISNIENKYMKNCQPEYIEHWQKVRARLFEVLLKHQLEEFDYAPPQTRSRQ